MPSTAPAFQPPLMPTASISAEDSASPHQQYILHKRRIALPSLRLPTTTQDFEVWESALNGYLADLESSGQIVTEDLKVSEAKRMLGAHAGKNSYYDHAMQWRSSEPTLSKFLRILRGWHLFYTDTHHQHAISDVPLISDGIFARPVDRNIRDWVVSPRVIEALRTDYDVWPTPAYRIGGLITTLACQVVHHMAFEDFLIDENKPRGKYGSQYDLDKIVTRFETPSDLLHYLVDWVHRHPYLEREFIEKRKKQIAHWKEVDETHYHQPSKDTKGFTKPTTKTVMAYDHSRSSAPDTHLYPRSGRPSHWKSKPHGAPKGGAGPGSGSSGPPKGPAGPIPASPSSTSSGSGATGKPKAKGGGKPKSPCFLCRVVNPAAEMYHNVENCPHFSREPKNEGKAAKE